jgi:hypothetical protein
MMACPKNKSEANGCIEIVERRRMMNEKAAGTYAKRFGEQAAVQ